MRNILPQPPTVNPPVDRTDLKILLKRLGLSIHILDYLTVFVVTNIGDQLADLFGVRLHFQSIFHRECRGIGLILLFFLGRNYPIKLMGTTFLSR